MGIFVFGLSWLIGGSLGSFYGSVVLLNGSAIATISGFVLMLLILYDRTKKKDAVFSK
jgi:hypothetical protein